MKPTFSILLAIAIGISSCNNNQQAESILHPEIKNEFAKVNDFLKQYEEPSQHFKVSSEKPTKVSGKQGTILSIIPADLEKENGQAIGKYIEIELKELTNQEQLVRTNTQTTSNGKLLVSGGAYYINLTSDGTTLKLKDQKKMSVEFPKITSDEMYLFYGAKDTLGQMEWQQVDQKFENRPIKTQEPQATITEPTNSNNNDIDAIFEYVNQQEHTPSTRQEQENQRLRNEAIAKKDALEQRLYKAIDLSQFGWINCDRFYGTENITNLKFSFNTKDSIDFANVYLVYTDINSLMHNSYYAINNQTYNSEFFNIPIGAKTQLLVLALKNGKAYTYKSDITIKASETIPITLTETKEEHINKLFKIK